MFQELLLKTSLKILFLLDIVMCCCMLHNLIMNGKDENIETFMAQLEVENDQRNASVGTMMKEETQANMDDELNNLYEMMNYLGLHKEHN